MNLKYSRLTLLVAIAFSCVSGCVGQCPLKLEQAPVVSGFRLGSTREQAKKQFPKLKFWPENDRNGFDRVTLDWSHQTPRDVLGDQSEGLLSLELGYLDNRLSFLRVTFTGWTHWQNCQEFLASLIKELKLPPPANLWQPERLNNSTRTSMRLVCGEVTFLATMDPVVGRDEAQTQILTLARTGLTAILKDRESKQ